MISLTTSWHYLDSHISWDQFISFIRSVPNYLIDDELLKKYFYRGEDDKSKAVFDTIVGSSYSY